MWQTVYRHPKNYSPKLKGVSAFESVLRVNRILCYNRVKNVLLLFYEFCFKCEWFL